MNDFDEALLTHQTERGESRKPLCAFCWRGCSGDSTINSSVYSTIMRVDPPRSSRVHLYGNDLFVCDKSAEAECINLAEGT